MIIADNLRGLLVAGSTGRTMGIEQSLRIDLEMGFRGWVDVGSRGDVGDGDGVAGLFAY